MQILEIRIDELTKQQALEKARGFLLTGGPHKIFTPNPEMLVDARRDPSFKAVLNGGDMNLCDGFGIWSVLRLSSRAKRSEAEGSLSKPQIDRITGVDFMLDLCTLAEKANKSIYLLGSGSDEVVKKTAQVLQEKFPILKIVGQSCGPRLQVTGYRLQVNEDDNEDTIHDIILSAPDILFVAFGHGKQEKWIAENLRDLPSVKIAMGVGGAFDFISGHVKRAPKIMRKIGLEWVWRLMREPRRIGRIWKATFVFLFMFYRTRISRITRIRQDHG